MQNHFNLVSFVLNNEVDLMSQLVPVPLGVSSGKILDPQLAASSELDIYHTANQARLHNEKQGKC